MGGWGGEGLSPLLLTSVDGYPFTPTPSSSPLPHPLPLSTRTVAYVGVTQVWLAAGDGTR